MYTALNLSYQKVLAYGRRVVRTWGRVLGQMLALPANVGVGNMGPNLPGKNWRTPRLFKRSLKDIVGEVAICFVLLVPMAVLWHAPVGEGPQPQPPTQEEYIASKSDLPWYEAQRFYYHIQTRLPMYRKQFESAAEQYGVPWTLLAAQAYQESRWDKHAKSPTGVRGLMMLTRNTASSLGIKNRLDPEKSIEGGARYLVYLKNRIRDEIAHPDRTWIALAAYNVGWGHIQDAQQLATRFSKNPESWSDLKTVLPLLAKKKYYKQLPYGYARGWEPVHYVKRIRTFRTLLEQYFSEI